MSTSVIEGAALNASDRCDRCGAQAYVRVTLASGFDLLFCAHHSKEHADKLKQVALEIHDESERIVASRVRDSARTASEAAATFVITAWSRRWRVYAAAQRINASHVDSTCRGVRFAADRGQSR